jgi:hypothetical protein
VRSGRDARLPTAEASGHAGRLYAVSRAAAELGAWSLRLQAVLPRTYLVAALVRSADAYWATQGPFRLVLEVGDARWTWDGVAAEPAPGRELVVVVRGAPAVERVAALPAAAARR